MESQSLELEVKNFVIETLRLEDIKPEDIDPNAPLFGEGLGLDSVDALEIGVALQKRYGIKLDAKSDETKHYFSSITKLSELIAEKRSKA